MNEELKSCPACGSEGVINIVGHGVNLYQVRCKKCSQCGPIEATANNAETRWNALPRALVWTTELPKVEGFYWRRYTSIIPQVVFVYYTNNTLMFAMCGDDYHRPISSDDPVKWAGPIPEPQEPTP